MKIEIPFIISGEIVARKEHSEHIKFRDQDIELSVPLISSSDILKIKDSRKHLQSLHDLRTEEIISFLARVRDKWQKGCVLRERAVNDLVEVTGYSRQMIEYSMEQINQLLTPDYLNLLIECELGSAKIMDDWIKRGESFVHCQPRGTVLHILAGNAPTISVMSFLRGVLTKNYNILKMASQDMITLSYLAQVFIEIDANHPITKATSVIYWPNDRKDILDEFIKMSDVICAWGGTEAIEAVKSHSMNKELLIFGPRRGIQLIGKGIADVNETAKKAAHDLVVFDQEACFSPQICFFEGSIGEAKLFAAALENALKEEGNSLPKGKMTLHQVASLSHAQRCSLFLGHEVFFTGKMDYTLIITENIEHTRSHPLGRTLFIIPVKNIGGAVSHIGHETQVVAIEPFDRAYELREELTNKGVDRITHLGKMPYFAAGAPHDGIYPLSRLVRWVKSR